MTRFLHILLITTLFIACKKQEIGPQCPTCEEEVVPTTTDVLIGCEGNFGWGNASISKYNPNDFSVSQQVFQNVNGFSLGDVLQSFCSYQNKLYIVMNNSGKIEVIDTSDYSYQNTISGLNSPRFMVTSNSKGYISDLYNNGVYVIDLAQDIVIDTISVGRWSEDLLVDGDDLYICCPDTNWVLKYDLSVEQYTDTIIVGKSPSGIQQSNDGNIWIVSSGGYQVEIPNLIEYDGTSITRMISFSSISDNPSQLSYNSQTNQLLFLNDGVYSFDLSSNNLPSSAIISPNGAVFYGLEIDPNNSDIYVTDAIDYVQSGRVIRYDSLYQPIDTFSTGIIPQAIWFK